MFTSNKSLLRYVLGGSLFVSLIFLPWFVSTIIAFLGIATINWYWEGPLSMLIIDLTFSHYSRLGIYGFRLTIFALLLILLFEFFLKKKMSFYA